MTKIAIIGAGLTGLTVATALPKTAEVTLFEKSRGTSGRLSTRRATTEPDQTWQLDHGCPYIDARDLDAPEWVESLCQAGILASWSPRIASAPSGTAPDDLVDQTTPNTWLVGVPGMNAIGKHLSQGLEITTSIRIISLTRRDGAWMLQTEDGDDVGPFDWVISAIPSDQALDILPATPRFYDALDPRKMTATYCLMVGLKAAPTLPWDMLTTSDMPCAKIIANHSKPSRTGLPGLVVHADPTWSQQYIDDDRPRIQAEMLAALQKHVPFEPSDLGYTALHGWRFAGSAEPGTTPYFVDPDLNLIACGDWCLGGDVAGALKSGWAVADHLKDHV